MFDLMPKRTNVNVKKWLDLFMSDARVSASENIYFFMRLHRGHNREFYLKILLYTKSVQVRKILNITVEKFNKKGSAM